MVTTSMPADAAAALVPGCRSIANGRRHGSADVPASAPLRWLHQEFRNRSLGRTAASRGSWTNQAVSAPRFSEQLRRAVAHSGDRTLPLRLGSAIRSQDLGLPGYLAMSSATLGDAMQVLARCARLTDASMALHVVREANGIVLQRPPSAGSTHPMVALFAMAAWTAIARELTELPSLPVVAQLPSETGVSSMTLTQFFGVRPRIRPSMNRLRFDAACWQIPVATGNPEVHAALRERAEAQLQMLDADRDIVAALRGAIRAGLADGRHGLAGIADTLGMSPRTLQARLSARGVGFHRIRQDLRRELAEAYLAESRLSLTEIALRLGYSDQSSFSHAFRGWTGMSPGDFRRIRGTQS